MKLFSRFTFDIAFSSVLKRAMRTLWIALEEMDRLGFRQNARGA